MKAIVTVVGRDKPGIIASVSTLLSNANVNIEDISQTIVSGKFTMITVCNIEKSKLTFLEIHDQLVALGEKIGVSIHVQHEDVFNAMHRV